MVLDPTFHILAPENAYWLHKTKAFDREVDPDQLANFVADQGDGLIFTTIGDDVMGFASGTIMLHPDNKTTLFINEFGVAKASGVKESAAHFARS